MLPDRLDLNLLRPLSVLLRLRNVTRAAEELGLSQSATSDTLRRLREALDDPLLVRHGRDLVLTPYAEAVREPVEDLLAGAERLRTHRTSFDPGTSSRTFVVMGSDYVLHTIGPPLLAAVARAGDRITVEMRELVDDYADPARRDELDAVITSTTLAEHELADLSAREVFGDEFVCVGWLDSPTSTNAVVDGRVSPAAFSGLGYVQYGPGGLVALADRALAAAGLAASARARVESQLLVPDLVSGSDWVAILPRRLADSARESARLWVARPPVAMPPIAHVASWHPRRDHDPAHQWFATVLTTLDDDAAPDGR